MEKGEILEEKKVIENYVESIYVYDNAGVCLTSCGIKPENLDEHIVSGFFTAIKKFGQKLIPGTVVKSLIMSGHKLFYNNFENITFCIQCYDDLPNQVIDYILNRISNQFLEIYQERLPIRDGNISIFSDFSTYLSQFMEQPLIEGLLEDFGYKVLSEGVILFDEIREKILFAKVPEEYSSRKQIAMSGMLINFAKKLSNEYQGGDVNSILISSENRWICISKREYIYIIVLFPKTKNIELNIIVEKTEEILDNILKMLKIELIK
ncbi:MAG: hypothetical protein CEE43_02590 [Promethearchaeota archaeon Loki_b32]|nr:MAG: hypothetical protein CEE43_02590 [Candidatus Lokiarchaeota archaeon Loki_b32]